MLNDQRPKIIIQLVHVWLGRCCPVSMGPQNVHIVTPVQQLGLNGRGEKPKFERNSIISDNFLLVATSKCIDCPFQQKDELTVICLCISGLSRYSSFFRNIWVDSTFRFLPLPEIEAVMLFATHCSDHFLWVWFSVWDICSGWNKIDWEFIVTAPVNSQTTLTLNGRSWLDKSELRATNDPQCTNCVIFSS